MTLDNHHNSSGIELNATGNGTVSVRRSSRSKKPKQSWSNVSGSDEGIVMLNCSLGLCDLLYLFEYNSQNFVIIFNQYLRVCIIQEYCS